MFTDLVNDTNIRVVQCGGSPGLTLESHQGLAIRNHLARQELERHLATQPRVLGLVDHSHTTSANLLQNVIVRNGLASDGGFPHGSRRPDCTEEVPAAR